MDLRSRLQRALRALTWSQVHQAQAREPATQLVPLYTSLSSIRPQTAVPNSPVLFGRYQAQDFVGIGGTALVVTGADLTLKRVVALKIWNPDIGNPHRWSVRSRADDSGPFMLDNLQYFRREAQLLAKLDHPNLCKVYDFGVSDDGVPWIAMEYVRGGTLRGLIEDWRSHRRAHELSEVLMLARQMISAVAYLHSSGLYQLDVKPENCLLDGSKLKLIDIATGLERPSRSYKIERDRFGTPGYVAPEVFMWSTEPVVSTRSDVFSIGITLLEMCCLDNPLAENRLRTEIYDALGVVNSDLMVDYSTVAFYPSSIERQRGLVNAYCSRVDKMDVRQLLAAAPFIVPEPLVSLIERSLQRDANKRPRDAGEVLSEIISMVQPSSTRPDTILFISSDPTDASRLRLGRELREIQEKLQLASMRDRFRLVQRMAARPADLSQALLDERPRLVHFSGHGTPGGGLCFEDAMGRSQPVTPEALASLFALVADHVDAVILNACFSAAQAEAIGKYVRYVIGMSDAIGDDAAIAFAVGFYQAIGAGRSVDEAYAFGRAQISLQGISEHLTPILVRDDI